MVIVDIDCDLYFDKTTQECVDWVNCPVSPNFKLNMESNKCEKVQIDSAGCLKHQLFYEFTSQLCVAFKECQKPIFRLDKLTNMCIKNEDTLEICQL